MLKLVKGLKFRGKEINCLLPIPVVEYLEMEECEDIDEDIYIMICALYPEWKDMVDQAFMTFGGWYNESSDR